METLLTYGLPGVLAFGSVGVVNMLLAKYKHVTLDNTTKLYLLAGFAFVYLYIPTDLGNAILNQLKTAFGIAVAVHALNSGLKRAGGTE